MNTAKTTEETNKIAKDKKKDNKNISNFIKKDSNISVQETKKSSADLQFKSSYEPNIITKISVKRKAYDPERMIKMLQNPSRKINQQTTRFNNFFQNAAFKK